MIILKTVNFKMLRCQYFEYYCAEIDSVAIHVNKWIMSYLCKKEIFGCEHWIVKIHKTLNTHSVTLATLHCSGLSFVVSPSTQPPACLSICCIKENG